MITLVLKLEWQGNLEVSPTVPPLAVILVSFTVEVGHGIVPSKYQQLQVHFHRHIILDSLFIKPLSQATQI